MRSRATGIGELRTLLGVAIGVAWGDDGTLTVISGCARPGVELRTLPGVELGFGADGPMERPISSAGSSGTLQASGGKGVVWIGTVGALGKIGMSDSGLALISGVASKVGSFSR